MNKFAIISEKFIGERLDTSLAKAFTMSRSQIQRLLISRKISIDGMIVSDGSKKVLLSGVCAIINDEEQIHYDQEMLPEPQNIKLNIVYEDDDIIVIDKEAGMVCHPAPGNPDGTLVNALLYHCKSLSSGNGDVARPGIVHRLDKDTSGLMIVAKTNEAHAILSCYFSDKTAGMIKRKYKCFTFGTPSNNCIKNNTTSHKETVNVPSLLGFSSINQNWDKRSVPNFTGYIDTFIIRNPKNRQKYMVSTDETGKQAITLYNVLKTKYITSTKTISLVECQLCTGRTHQIRIHMQHIGCPIIGDPMYGKKKIEHTYPEITKNFNRTALHSYSLEFIHPISKEPMRFESELPEDMQELELEIFKTYAK